MYKLVYLFIVSIDLQQIHSFITELDGKNLKISDDEVQRIKINS